MGGGCGDVEAPPRCPPAEPGAEGMGGRGNGLAGKWVGGEMGWRGRWAWFVGNGGGATTAGWRGRWVWFVGNGGGATTVGRRGLWACVVDDGIGQDYPSAPGFAGGRPGGGKSATFLVRSPYQETGVCGRLRASLPVETRKTGQITRLLVAAGQGDAAAHERLWAALYEELHFIARRQLAAESPGHTLQPTSLVHEAYLRLIDDDGHDVCWENRRHFFSAAAQAMRRIRIDDARKRNRLKRGGPGVASVDGAAASEEASRGLTFDSARMGPRRDSRFSEQEPATPLRSVVDGAGDGHAAFDQDPAEVLAIDEALTRLEQEDPRQAEVVVLRYFAGLSIDESAEALEVSPRTVDNDWRYAKAWLHRELSKGDTTMHWLSNRVPADEEAGAERGG